MKVRFNSLCLLATVAFLGAACGDNSAPVSEGVTDSTPAVVVPASGPAIIASPNPAPASRGSMGTTTVAWNTGDGAGDVYLSTDGSAEKLFAHGEYGSQEAPWIAAGTKYEFRLYSAADRSKPLASVVVTKSP